MKVKFMNDSNKSLPQSFYDIKTYTSMLFTDSHSADYNSTLLSAFYTISNIFNFFNIN